MQNIETQNTGPDELPVDRAIASAREKIGSSKPNTREKWNEDVIQKRILDRGSRGNLSLIEIYEHNADLDRIQALRIMNQAKGRELTEKEHNEVIVAHVHVTLMESLGGALNAYMDVVDQYRILKNAGLKAPLEKESLVLQHLQLVTQSAERRSAAARQIRQARIDNVSAQEISSLQKRALEADDAMLRLLAPTDRDIPGANKEGILPAHSLILEMLKRDYELTMDTYRRVANKDDHKAIERTEKAKVALQRAKGSGNLTKEEADAVLSQMRGPEFPDGYDLTRYNSDLLVLQHSNSTYEQLRANAKKNIEKLGEVTMAIGRYQLHRAELTSIRHHFDQAYDLRSRMKPLPGETSPTALRATKEFLEAQQQSSMLSLERHLEIVGKGVLKVGLKEKAETLWNKNARLWVGGIAERIATAETAWIPETPLMDIHKLAKEGLLSGLPEALGWPRDEKGDLKPWSTLTDREKQELQKKQTSIETHIREFRESHVLENMQTSLGAAKELMRRKDLRAEGNIQATEIDEKTLPTEIVRRDNIDELVKRYGAPVVYKMCFVQLRGNWEQYGVRYKTLLEGFNNTIGVHYDISGAMRDFADKQVAISKMLVWLALLAGIAIGALGTAILWKGTSFMLRKSANLAKRGLGSRLLWRAMLPIGAGVALRETMLRDARLEPLDIHEYEAITAAIELMEQHGNKKAARYNIELEYLKNRLEAWKMEKNSERILHELQKLSPNGNEQAEKLKKRAEDAYRNARHHKEEFHKLFPITKYLVTDPKKDRGNVGINLRKVDDARKEGYEYEQMHGGKFKLSDMFKERKEIDVDTYLKRLKEAPSQEDQAKIRAEVMGMEYDPREYFMDLKTSYRSLVKDVEAFLE